MSYHARTISFNECSNLQLLRGTKMIRFLIFLAFFIIFTTGNTGCDRDLDGVDEETSVSVVKGLDEELPSQELASIERFFDLPLEERNEKAAELTNTYIQLKDKDFKAAVIALKKAAYIIAKGPNPLLQEWVEIGTRILGVKEGLLVDLLRSSEIELEIAETNNEDEAYIAELKVQHKEVQAAIDHLKAQGVDPNVFKVEFQPLDEPNE